MKQRIWTLVAFLAVTAAVAAQDAPKVNGKTAVQWGKQLQSMNEEQRIQAAAALEEMGKNAKPAGAALIRALGDRNPDVHVKVAAALTAIGKDAVPALTQVVRGKDEDSRVRAIQILGQIGPDAKSAMSTLSAAVKDRSVLVREQAADAIDKIKGDATPRAKGSRIGDFAGVWSGRAEPNSSFPNAQMRLEFNAKGEGQMLSRPGGDSNANLDKRFTVTIKSVKDGKVTLPGNWELQLNADGTILTVKLGSGIDRLTYQLKKE